MCFIARFKNVSYEELIGKIMNSFLKRYPNCGADMRVLVLHSDIAPDAPPDEQDTLITADAICEALTQLGHEPSLAAFSPDTAALKKLIDRNKPEIVFNMVESVFGEGEQAPIAPAMLEKLRVPYTGVRAAPMAAAGDKPLAKRILRAAGLPTADWFEPPHWDGVCRRRAIRRQIGDRRCFSRTRRQFGCHGTFGGSRARRFLPGATWRALVCGNLYRGP